MIYTFSTVFFFYYSYDRTCSVILFDKLFYFITKASQILKMENSPEMCVFLEAFYCILDISF